MEISYEFMPMYVQAKRGIFARHDTSVDTIFPPSNWNPIFLLVFNFLFLSCNVVQSFDFFVIRLGSVLLWKYCLPFVRVNS